MTRADIVGFATRDWRFIEDEKRRFADPFGIYLDDGSGTGNMVVIGTSLRERFLYVVHVERGDRDRIMDSSSPLSRDR